MLQQFVIFGHYGLHFLSGYIGDGSHEYSGGGGIIFDGWCSNMLAAVPKPISLVLLQSLELYFCILGGHQHFELIPFLIGGELFVPIINNFIEIATLLESNYSMITMLIAVGSNACLGKLLVYFFDSMKIGNNMF